LAKVTSHLFGDDRPPLFCRRTDGDFWFALVACLLIVPANVVKFYLPDHRQFIDWIPINFFILWLIPLAYYWRRHEAQQDLFRKRVGRTRLLVGFAVVVLVLLFRDYDLSGPHSAVGSLSFLLFQIAVQTSEVLFFFVFFQRRAEAATGVIGGVLLTGAAYMVFQAAGTEPLVLGVWLTWLVRGMFVAGFFALFPHAGLLWLLLVLVGVVDQSHTLQTKQVKVIVAVDTALKAAQALALYGVTLALAAWLGVRRARLRKIVAVMAVVTLLLAVVGWLVFSPISHEMHLNAPLLNKG